MSPVRPAASAADGGPVGPVHWPAAEVAVDERLVRALLEDQYPDLAPLSLRMTDAGWDNWMFRLGSDRAVRLPRRAASSALIGHEQAHLPDLAPHLPLPVPAPERTGHPACGYPWSWSVVPWLRGEPGDRTPVTDGVRAGTDLGRFLTALHRPAPPSAPFNEWRGVPLRARRETFAERLEFLGDHIDGPALRGVWDRALGADPWVAPPLWLHGDLHPANTLVADGTISAVIDFGDICAGDPATDVAAAWMLLPSGGAPAFRAAYPVDDALLARAAGWAALLGLMLLGIGLAGRPTYAERARQILRRVAADPALQGVAEAGS